MFNSKTYPYWVAKTDYDGYAVMYSCWQKLENGTCHPEYTYLWTLNRKPTGHTPAQMEEIKQAAADLCIPMDNYKTFKQDGGCEFDPNDPPKGGTLFMFLISCVCVFIVLLIMLCCCCICIGNTDDFKRKKMQWFSVLVPYRSNIFGNIKVKHNPFVFIHIHVLLFERQEGNNIKGLNIYAIIANEQTKNSISAHDSDNSVNWACM